MSRPSKDIFQMTGSQVGPGRTQNESVGPKTEFQLWIWNDQTHQIKVVKGCLQKEKNVRFEALAN